MKPIEVHPSLQSTSRRMSSEERKLARLTGSMSDDVSNVKIAQNVDLMNLFISLSLSLAHQGETDSSSDLHANQDSTTTYVLESGPSDPYISDSLDSSTAAANGDPKPISDSVAVNTNCNNDNESGKFVTITSLYVTAAPVDTPATTEVSCDGEKDHSSSERTSEHEGKEMRERETVNQEQSMKPEQLGRVEIVLHNPANSTPNDSVSSDTSKSNNSVSPANPTPNVQPSDLL